MINRLKPLIIWILLLSATHAECTTLHVLIVADVNDRAIGRSVQLDVAHIEREMRSVAIYTGMELEQRVFAGQTFVRKDIKQYIKNLEVGSDDTFVFFYAGHGYRTADKETQWPVMFFGWDEKGLDVQYIIDLMEAKDPRMTLILTDCCNEFYDDYDAPLYRHPISRSVFKSSKEQGYAKLFLHFSGTIIATGAEIGAPSFGYDSTGGVFTSGFLSALDEEVEESHPSWEMILEKTKLRVINYQLPLYEIMER